jgi:flagellar hook-associated protein 3 FlgL
MIRVTDGATKYGSLYGMQSANSRLQSLTEQMSTGRQITKPSDDPSNTVRALQLRGDVKRNTQYTNNSQDAIGWMSTSDSAYTQIVSMAQKARTLVVQGLNSGSSTGTSNTAIADEIHSIRESILQMSNTTYNGRPVFGGNTTNSVAYQEDPTTGNIYFVGDNTDVNRQVGDNTVVTINQQAQTVFGPQSTTPSAPGNDIFSLLTGLEDALRGTGTRVGLPLTGNDLNSIDAAVKQISSQQAVEGATYNRVTATQAAQSTTNLALTSELSDIQDVDLAAQAVAVSTANVTYQAALQTTASIRQMSLLDFLK